MAQKNLKLIAADGTFTTFETSNRDVQESGYVKATLIEGFWIVHSYRNYNPTPAESQKENICIVKGPVQDLELPFSPKSVYQCQNELDSCTVFEHFYYGGVRKDYKEANFDITKDFPPDTAPGASGIIIFPKKAWEIFTAVNFGGKQSILKASWYPTPEDMGFPNDRLASLHPN